VRHTTARALPVAGAFVFALVLGGTLAAQQPAPANAPAQPQQEEKYKNLKVLPEDTTRAQMTVIMHGFADSLGVNCTFCHAGTPPKIDFASDDKDEKKSARVMMKMTMAINKETLPQLEGMSDDAEVTCYTCHRGAKHPTKAMAELLSDTAATKGAPAAIDEYKSLKEKSADAGLYDFRVNQIVAAGNHLRDTQKTAESVALFKAAVPLFPNSSDLAAALGMSLAQSGDKAAAETELQRALTLDPKNFGAKMALDRLHGVAPGPPPAPPKQ
jgi:tetratricopeptide (TPR) repeat protein